MTDSFEDPRVMAAVIGAAFGFLGGFVAPFIKSKLEESSHRRKLEFENSLTKQNNLILQQINLLENLAKCWHKLTSKASKVSFYKIYAAGLDCDEQKGRLKKALDEYHDDGWVLFDELRHQIRRSKHLVSNHVYEKLMKYYLDYEIIDAKIISMANDENYDTEQINQLHEQVHQTIPNQIDDAIEEIATEIGLSAGTYAFGSQQSNVEYADRAPV